MERSDQKVTGCLDSENKLAYTLQHLLVLSEMERVREENKISL